MSKSRIDAKDQVELAHHALAKLTAEGWIIQSLDQEFEHKRVGKVQVPVAATLTVRLVPAS